MSKRGPADASWEPSLSKKCNALFGRKERDSWRPTSLSARRQRAHTLDLRARCFAPSGARRRPARFDPALRGPSGPGAVGRAAALRPAAGVSATRELRETVAPLRGMSLDDYNAGQMTCDLRRLRLRGLIERIPHGQRYRLTAEGLCITLAYHRTQSCPPRSTGSRPPVCKAAIAAYDREVGHLWEGHALAACSHRESRPGINQLTSKILSRRR